MIVRTRQFKKNGSNDVNEIVCVFFAFYLETGKEPRQRREKKRESPLFFFLILFPRLAVKEKKEEKKKLSSIKNILLKINMEL